MSEKQDSNAARATLKLIQENSPPIDGIYGAPFDEAQEQLLADSMAETVRLQAVIRVLKFNDKMSWVIILILLAICASLSYQVWMK